MIANSFTVALSGIDVISVNVQVQMSSGMPSFTIVGLADKTISESKERVRAALNAFGLSMPAKKILINLAPADLVKEGSHFDLPIACAILAVAGIIPQDQLEEFVIMGELALDGSLLPVAGVLPTAISANSSGKGIICPYGNGKEAAWSANKNILAPKNLLELTHHFQGKVVLDTPTTCKPDDIEPEVYVDISHIKGQETAKRALEITAAGNHNLLMFGAPGTGKSMLASALPGILPSMTAEEILECSIIASIAGLIQDGQLNHKRPFRAPHHSCSIPAMVGGGTSRKVKPGEISLAHNGVLFLDELPEFPKTVIDSLRQPIETGSILISRVNSHVRYPASFQLVAAMNPCKCGYLDDPDRACSKAPRCAGDYQTKVSGPIMDRFDIHVPVPPIQDYRTELQGPQGATSKQVAQRVKTVRDLQKERYSKYALTNSSKLDGDALLEFARPSPEAKSALNIAANKFKFSMRAYNRVLKVARTIADLEAAEIINTDHISEALHYRQMHYRI